MGPIREHHWRLEVHRPQAGRMHWSYKRASGRMHWPLKRASGLMHWPLKRASLESGRAHTTCRPDALALSESITGDCACTHHVQAGCTGSSREHHWRLCVHRPQAGRMHWPWQRASLETERAHTTCRPDALALEESITGGWACTDHRQAGCTGPTRQHQGGCTGPRREHQGGCTGPRREHHWRVDVHTPHADQMHGPHQRASLGTLRAHTSCSRGTHGPYQRASLETVRAHSTCRLDALVLAESITGDCVHRPRAAGVHMGPIREHHCRLGVHTPRAGRMH
ncbi:hypothetical protein NDU88_009052 [Pleurodeles waltl]|uniref:Uncharacterized protein n=1 Tax=Pleurodeles waltl TaxID=8319 RepID=A0AAV7P235_PLEWA|nr:hypothetical protein NDU88_009052 [Pleurodeles waltl]